MFKVRVEVGVIMTVMVDEDDEDMAMAMGADIAGDAAEYFTAMDENITSIYTGGVRALEAERIDDEDEEEE